MHFAGLIRIRPLPFAACCWVVAIVFAAMANGFTSFGLLAVLAGLACLLLLYGYPLWVVFASGLGATTRAKQLTAIPLLGLVVLVIVAFLVDSRGQVRSDLPVPWWKGVLGAIVGVSLFLPLGAAAATLHAAELRRGIRRVAGGITAFLWFFYFFLGWGPLHKRVRLAAGIEG